MFTLDAVASVTPPGELEHAAERIAIRFHAKGLARDARLIHDTTQSRTYILVEVHVIIATVRMRVVSRLYFAHAGDVRRCVPCAFIVIVVIVI